MEVRPLRAVRSVTAAAVLAAAVLVYAAVRRDRRLHRQLAQERVAATSSRLMAGCVYRDLNAFRRRIDLAAAQRAVVDAADRVLDEALATHSIDPTQEGGPA